MTTPTVKTDMLIIGGGIAGLWLLGELNALGFNALLCEDQAIGHGQTIASQGIIHGGTKYSLTGSVSQATLAIGDMPRIWKEALQGIGPLNLQGVNWLTENQLLWTSPNLASKMTGFFASKVMQSRMQAVDKSNFPIGFNDSAFKGKLYQLDEPVLDIPSLLKTFQQQFSDALVHTNFTQLQENNGDYFANVRLTNGNHINIQAQHIFITAGEGNETFIKQLSSHEAKPSMQRRPLQMLLVKGDLPMIYAHGLGISDKPRITITSHINSNNENIWYIGGEPAENGVGKTAKEAIENTKQCLHELLPWIPTQNLEWATYNVDRAEGQQADGSRPNNPVHQTMSNVTLAWPTKLAFAPMLARTLIKEIEHLEPLASTDAFIKTLPTPPVATAIWDKADWVKAN
jgi:glycine/D-amino acid oxidase-like deaminating enzyme